MTIRVVESKPSSLTSCVSSFQLVLFQQLKLFFNIVLHCNVCLKLHFLYILMQLVSLCKLLKIPLTTYITRYYYYTNTDL